MKQKREMVIFQQDMNDAVAYWLNKTQLQSGCQAEVQNVTEVSGGKFDIEFEVEDGKQ